MKTTTRVKVTDETGVQQMLDEGQGRASARTVSFSDVVALAKYGEDQLAKLGVPQKIRTGAQASYYPPSVPNSYNYAASGTFMTVTRGTKDWYLTSVARGNAGSCSYGKGSTDRLKLTLEQQLHYVRTNPLLCDVIPVPRSCVDSHLLVQSYSDSKALLNVAVTAKTYEVPKHQRTTLEEM